MIIHYLGASNWYEYKVGNHGHPYMTFTKPNWINIGGPFWEIIIFITRAGEFKNNFLTFPSNWFQIGSDLTEPAGFDAIYLVHQRKI
jgi:hypothetical protein